MKETIQGYEIQNTATKKLPKWKRTIFHNETTDTIFFPAGNMEVMCAMYDGIPIIPDKKHNYLPMDWLHKEFPNDGYNEIEEVIRTKIIGI